MEVAEGMVAIVQGSRHAGLTVTVLPERPRALKRKYYNIEGGVKTTTRVSKSNVETYTESILKNSSIPICDIRYASSYQFANCLRPPLRGNSYVRPAYNTDHFAQSLRKYPTASNSAQLIQRLLDYTQARNDKKSHLSKSKRTLLRKSTSQQTNRIIRKHGDEAKANIKIVRTPRKVLHHSASTVTKKCSSQEELLNYTYDYLKSSSLLPRSTEVRYLTKMKKALKDRLQEIIDNKPMTCPRSHSRYILHKRKYHENTLNHVPIFHRCDKETEAQFPRKSRDVRTCTRKTSSNVTEPHSGKICICEQSISCVCEKTTFTDKANDEKIKSFDEKEMQTILKEINEWLNHIPVYPNFSKVDKIKQEETINKLASMLKKLKKDAHFNFTAKKEIHKCLNALPMWHPTDLNDDILLKEQIADNLIEKLIQMAESNLKEEISKEIKKLPFDSVSISSTDLETVIEKFTQKLKPLAANHSLNDKEYKEVLKTEIMKLFDDLPFKFIDQTTTKVGGIAEKMAEQLCNIKLPASNQNAMVLSDFGEETEKILDWYKNISEFKKFHIKNDKNLLDELVRKINEYIIRGLHRDDELVELQEEIEHWLDKVALKINGRLDTNTKKDLSNKLMQKFFASDNNAVKSKVNDGNDLTENNFSQIFAWFEDIPELSIYNKNENSKAIKIFARQLDEILSRDENFKNGQIKIKEAILNWLQNLLKNNNKSLDSMTKENLVNQLVFKLNNFKPNKQEQNQDLHNDVITWLKENSGIKSNINCDQNVIDNLITKLTDIENNSNENIIEAQTKDAITTFIKTLSDKIGINFPFKQQESLKQKLFKRMNIKQQQRKHWMRELNTSLETQQIQSGKELVTSTPKAYACERFPSTLSNASPIRNVSLTDQSLDGNTEYIQYFSDIKDAIEGWIKRFDLDITNTERSDLVKEIATDVIDRHKYLQLSENKTSKDNEVEHLKYQIFRRFKNLNNHEALSEIISKVNDLNELVVNIKVPELINQTCKRTRYEDFNFSKDIHDLVNSLKAWFNNNIHCDVQDSCNITNYDDFILQFAKQVANLKENSNRDFYLKNDISQWLSKLFPKLHRHLLNNWTKSLKNHLVDYLANDKDGEVTGLHYRKMLSDTISRIVPSLNNISADDLHHLEHLKEKITDAFINLHYFTEDKNMLDKFKTKLIREVNHFCDEYLKHYPEAPLNTEEVNRNLYSALKMVSVPNIESIRSELEQVRLKEEITDWLQKVPLNKSEDIEMQINQMVSRLAKCLHDIEKNRKNLEPSNTKNQQMETEITNWLKNLPIKEDEILNLPGFANNLIEKLNATSKCRTLSISKIGKYDDSGTLFQIGSTAAHYPRSTLSIEDRNHLNRIKKRLSYSRGENLIPTSKNASISPLLKDIGMQTEKSKIEEAIQTSRTSLIVKSSLINRDISPQVVIREFYWDSNGSIQSMQLNIPTSPQKTIAPNTTVSTTQQNTQTKPIRPTKEDDEQTVDIIKNSNNITPTQTKPIRPTKEEDVQTVDIIQNLNNITPAQTKAIRSTKEDDVQTVDIIQNFNNITPAQTKAIRPTKEDDVQTVDIIKNLNNITPAQTKAIRSTKEDDVQTVDIIQNLNNMTHMTPALNSDSKISPRMGNGVETQTDQILDKQRSNSTRSLCEGGIIPYVVRPPNLLSEAPPTYYTERARAISQRINSRPKVLEAGRSRGDICCTCGKRMFTKCRGRPYSGCRQHCNTNVLSCCLNCCSRCPYPSFLFFRKEF